MMKTITITMIAMAVVIFSLTVPALAKEGSVSGVVVTQSCLTQFKGDVNAEGFKDCVVASSEGGEALGIVTEDGKFYASVASKPDENPNAVLAGHIGMGVTASGDISEKDGALSIAIKSVEAAK